MSQLPTSATPVKIDVRISEALAQVAYLGVCVQGSMQAGVFDILSHHRLSMIKNAGTWPGRRNAQAMVASRLHRFTRANDGDAGITGQGFAAAVTGQKFGDAQFVREETGESVSSSEWMAVPIAEGLAMTRSPIAGRRQQFRDLVASRELMVIPAGGKLLLVRVLKGRGRKQILGILVKRRTEPGRLKFYETFDRVQAQDAPKLEKIIDLAATAAGRVKLEERNRAGAAGRASYTSAYREFLQNNPRRFREARQAAEAAKRSARGVITGGEGRA